MNIIRIEDRNPALVEQLVKVWKASVKETHTFLSDEEINRIQKYVSRALTDIPHLMIAENGSGVPCAFMGINEQNPLAKGFYEHMGFQVYKRTETDEQGRPYPVLYMRLSSCTPS